MATWEIMLGFQAFTALLSLAVVLRFMYGKESLDVASADVVVAAPAMAGPVVLAAECGTATSKAAVGM